MYKVEEKIRRYLAGNLSFLEAGLRLVEEEYHLPNPHGSKGFIDILAVDQNDHYVIIEIKRSNQAARQALHELFKYPSLLRHKLGVKCSEMRVMLVSTEWSELLLPFSEFVGSSNLDAKGYELYIDDEAYPTRRELVVPIESPMNRELSRTHLIFLYSKEDSVEENVEIFKNNFVEQGINDLVLVRMSTQKEIMFPFALYIAFRNYPSSTYIDILEQTFKADIDDELWEEIELLKEQDSDDEYNRYLEERVISLCLESVRYNVHYEDFEFGNPERLAYTLSRGWTVDQIHRAGIYEKDIRLTDERILAEELLGLSGVSFDSYMTQCHSDSRAKLEEIKTEVKRVLEYAPIWKTHILSAMDKHQGSTFNLSLFIYNPRNLLESLWTTVRDGNPNSLPQYHLLIDDEEESKTYIFHGFVSWDGSKPQFPTVMRNICRGDWFTFFLERFDGRNHEKIIKMLGFSHKTIVTVLEEDREREYMYEFREYQHELVPIMPVLDAYSFVKESDEFMKELTNFFDSYVVIS